MSTSGKIPKFSPRFEAVTKFFMKWRRRTTVPRSPSSSCQQAAGSARAAPNVNNMISRQRVYVNAVGRLCCASAAAARRGSSAGSRWVPARLYRHRQQQLQRHPSSPALLAPPPPPPPSLTTFEATCRPTAAVRTTGIARRCCSCSTRQDTQLGNSRRRFSALVRPSSTVQAAQQDTEPEKTGSERGGRQRVVVGMSGGVDSSVAAMLLQRQASGQCVPQPNVGRRDCCRD